MLNWNSKYFWPATFAILGVLGGAMLLFGQEGRGSWELQRERSGDEVRLTIRETQLGRSWTNTFDIRIEELRGLSRSTLEQGGAIKFELVRDAGRLIFQGDLKNGSGTGDFRFEPNPNFSKELSALGYTAPNEEDLFSMALLNVSLDYARAIRDAGLRASTKELVQLRIHGVASSYVNEAKSAGYANLTASDVVQMKIHGVSTAFLRDLKEAGYNLTTPEIVQLRIHGVNSDYMRDLKNYGLTPTASDITRLRIHGVTPQYLRDLKEAGYGSLKTGEITQLRIHGVQTEFMQETKRLGYSFSSKELVDLRIHGVNAAYLKKLQDAGFRNLSAAQIAKLRMHGVD
jgi:hypothetical protein